MATRSESLRGNQNAAGPHKPFSLKDSAEGFASSLSKSAGKFADSAKAAMVSGANTIKANAPAVKESIRHNAEEASVAIKSGVNAVSAMAKPKVVAIRHSAENAAVAMKNGVNSINAKITASTPAVKAKAAKMAATASAAAAAGYKSVASTVNNQMPAARKDRVRVDANRSAFLRSERKAQNAAEAYGKTTRGKIDNTLTEVNLATNRAARKIQAAVMSPAGMRLGQKSRDAQAAVIDKTSRGGEAAANAIKRTARTVAGGFKDVYGSKIDSAKKVIKKTYSSK